MDILATIKSFITSDSDILSQQLNSLYTVRDLSITNTGIKNVPTQVEINNLALLADVLAQIYNKVGPFQVISGFRTAEVQRTLASEGLPTSTNKSFHETGMAADIVPTTMGLTEFWSKLLNQKDLRKKLGEIAYKPSQGSIHLSLPSGSTVDKVMELKDGKYVKLTATEISSYMGSKLILIFAAVAGFGLWRYFKK